MTSSLVSSPWVSATSRSAALSRLAVVPPAVLPARLLRFWLGWPNGSCDGILLFRVLLRCGRSFARLSFVSAGFGSPC